MLTQQTINFLSSLQHLLEHHGKDLINSSDIKNDKKQSEEENFIPLQDIVPHFSKKNVIPRNIGLNLDYHHLTKDDKNDREPIVNNNVIIPVRNFKDYCIVHSTLVMIADKLSIVTFLNRKKKSYLPYYRYIKYVNDDEEIIKDLKRMYYDITLQNFPKHVKKITKFVYDGKNAIIVISVKSYEIVTGRVRNKNIKAIYLTGIGSLILALKGITRYDFYDNSIKILENLLPHLGYL